MTNTYQETLDAAVTRLYLARRRHDMLGEWIAEYSATVFNPPAALLEAAALALEDIRTAREAVSREL